MISKTNRLSIHTKPIKYQITITPDLANFTFVGTEKIQLEVSKATNELVLHSVDIQILKAEVKVGNVISLVKKISYQVKNETVTLQFAKKVSGKILLTIEFTGSINDQLRGFYRSKYIHNKKEKYLATSQFEATDARRAFPCFDEPSHKAVFEVSVIVPKHLQVISNTVESSIKVHEPGIKIVNFEPTPKMSSYLLALIVGEFEHLAIKTKRGVKIRVHTTPGKKAQGKFALEVAKKALDFLEDYFDIKYPLPVLDLIAIPDFSAGAMENWGAITFRETVLLVDDQNTSFLAKQRIAEVISHELVHQWFGNLVTMEWWTHLWLNESFATYMAYLTVDGIFPRWNYWTKFVLEEQSYALEADSLKSTHPIEVEVNHPDEINEIFDGISYSKGASSLRMLASYIGEDNFRNGLRLYLKKHSYKNTSSIHLWEAFEKVSKMPVRQFMKTWTTESGYPVVTIESKNNSIDLKQELFSVLPKKQTSKWTIPLLPIGLDSNVVLGKTSAKLSVGQSTKFIKLNSGEHSLFITNYSIGLLAKLLPELESGTLSSIDRLSIIRNALLLAKSGRLPSDVYLEILRYLGNEGSYIVWSEVDSGLEQISRLVSGTKVEQRLNSFKSELYGNLIQRLGFIPKKNEPENDAMLRGLAMLESGLAGNKKSIAEASKFFRNRLKGKRIPVDIKLAVYSVKASTGGQETYTQLIKLYGQTDNAHEKQQILFALTKFKSESIQKQVLKFILSDKVRAQDRPLFLSRLLNTPHFKKLAWIEIQKSWKVLHSQFSGSRLLGTILSGAKSFNSVAEALAFDRFVKNQKVAGAKQVITQTKEQIAINLAWSKRDLGLIGKYLA